MPGPDQALAADFLLHCHGSEGALLYLRVESQANALLYRPDFRGSYSISPSMDFARNLLVFENDKQRD